MRRPLSTSDVERLFVGAVDQSLPSGDAQTLEAELSADPVLQKKFAGYQRAISALKDAPREKAPDALASLILRRTRRRRFHLRGRELAQARFPVEVVVPMLIAALVALFMLISS